MVVSLGRLPVAAVCPIKTEKNVYPINALCNLMIGTIACFYYTVYCDRFLIHSLLNHTFGFG